MGLKPNKYLLFLFLYGLSQVRAQSAPETDTTYAVYTFDTADSSGEAGEVEFDPAYHYSESEQSEIGGEKPAEVFDRSAWEQLNKRNTFNETADTSLNTLKSKRRLKETGGGLLKYFWIIPVLLILIWLLYKLLPLLNQRNPALRNELLISDEIPDEEELRNLDTERAIRQALQSGDFRTAFRFRYLSVLKQLNVKNLIRYHKENTNYEYLLQLGESPLSEPFRILTRHFDGIWYGEKNIDRRRYEELEQYFSEIDRIMQSL